MDSGLADSTQPPAVTRLEGDGLHYQKTRQDSKPCSRTTMAGVTALVIIGLLIVISMLAADFQGIHHHHHHLPYKEQSIWTKLTWTQIHENHVYLTREKVSYPIIIAFSQWPLAIDPQKMCIVAEATYLKLLLSLLLGTYYNIVNDHKDYFVEWISFR